MKPAETTHVNTGCPNQEDLVDYFRRRLPEPRMAAIEAHFLSCELCIEGTRQVFETLVDLDSWTPESVGNAFRREALLTGLAQAEEDKETGSQWAERIRRWRQAIARAADGGIELIVAASGARLVTQTLRELVAPNGIQFEPIMAVRGPAETWAMASSEPEAPRAATVLSVEKPEVKITISEVNRVVVTLQSWPEDRLPPGILVIDTHGKQRPLVLELKRGASGKYETEFTREIGEHMLLFAPVEKKD